MSTVEIIDIKRIDPDGTSNVRRQGVEDNVEKVKISIQEHGYWPDQPIIIRPHPDSQSEYDYENVTGQCRLKACLALGLEEIPAFVLKLNDDEAIQRSWLENEIRGDLAASDKAYWIEYFYKHYIEEGYSGNEAYELAAKFLGVTVETAKTYYQFGLLPDSLKKMVDTGTLKQSDAIQIVKNTFDATRVEESQQAMEERASWILSLDRDNRKHGVKALQNLGSHASIEQLNAAVMQKNMAAKRVVQYEIPTELYDNLKKWGEERGLQDESDIIGRMVGECLTKR